MPLQLGIITLVGAQQPNTTIRAEITIKSDLSNNPTALLRSTFALVQ